MSFRVASNPRKASGDSLVVKAKLGDDIRKFRLSLVYDLNVDYSALRSLICGLFGITDEFRIKYKDEDDMISIVTIDDFKECVNEHLRKSTTLYLNIYPKTQTQLSVTSTQSSIEGTWRSLSSDTDGTVGHIEEPEIDVNDIVAEEGAPPETAVDEAKETNVEEKETKEEDEVQVHSDAGPTSAFTTPVTSTDSVGETAETKTAVDVEEALRFVSMVHEKFQGDDRAKQFLKIGADYHDKRISRMEFHEACLGLFAEDDDLMDAFLLAFKIEGDNDDQDEHVAPVQAQAEDEPVTPTPSAPTPSEETGDVKENAEETGATAADEVSPVAFMVNELQYARLLLQTRLQSLVSRTHKQIKRDTEPAMTELKAFVRKDIIESAREETHRVLNSARRAGADIPPTEELVSAVVKGLQQANDIAMEVTRDVTKSVCQAVRDAVAEEKGAAATAQSTAQSAPAHREEEEPVHKAEEPVQSSPTTPSSAPSPVPSEASERETVFTIGAAARQAAVQQEDVEQQQENEVDAPAADDDVPTTTSEKSLVGEAPAGGQSPLLVSFVDGASDSISNDSFIMVGKAGDDHVSEVSVAKPEPSASGDGYVVSDEAEEQAAAPTEPSYHQKAAAVQSSEEISNLFTLFDMGFQDFDTNRAVLGGLKNDLQMTVAELCEREEAKK